jgi:hypothetical protein
LAVSDQFSRSIFEHLLFIFRRTRSLNRLTVPRVVPVDFFSSHSAQKLSIDCTIRFSPIVISVNSSKRRRLVACVISAFAANRAASPTFARSRLPYGNQSVWLSAKVFFHRLRGIWLANRGRVCRTHQLSCGSTPSGRKVLPIVLSDTPRVSASPTTCK